MKKFTLFSTILITIITTELFAQKSGDLDSTFDADGILTTAIGLTTDVANSIVIQPDGKIVVAGFSNNGRDNDFALARYHKDGTLDLSFNRDGKLTTHIGSGYDIGYSAALQADGKIVVAGYSETGADIDFSLARYHANGALDCSFHADGKLTTAIGASDDYITSVAIQPDGKIVVGGFSFNGAKYDFALARYNRNGTPDKSFSSDGKVTTAIGSGSDYVYSITLQSDGKIVAAGFSYNGANNDFALARYNTNGSVDSSFSEDGKLTTDRSDDYAYSVALQSDGKIVAAGFSYNGTDYDFALARYNTNGTPDKSFSADGKVTTAVGTANDWIYSVTIQTDGKIVAAGFSNNGTDDDFALARYHKDGTLDNSFNIDGKLTTAIGFRDDVARSVAIQPDGKIVVAGESHNGTNNDFALARYITNMHFSPVAGLDFNGIADEANITLRWATPAEQNAAHYEVQRSSDNVAFLKIGTVNAASNSTIVKKYVFKDVNLLHDNYFYRIKQVDADGKFNYSSVINVKKFAQKIKVYPSPASSVVTVELPSHDLVNTQASIYNNRGQLVLQAQILSTRQEINIEQLPSGMYYLILSDGTTLKIHKN